MSLYLHANRSRAGLSFIPDILGLPDACTVIFAGRLLMRDRELLTMDEIKVCKDTNAAAKKLIFKKE